MTGYFSALRWGAEAPPDAPLGQLPPDEAAALALCAPRVAPELRAAHPADPWARLGERAARELALRFLRCNALDAARAVAHVRDALAWRRTREVWAVEHAAMFGERAGIPVLLLDAVGRDREACVYAPVEFYTRKAVDLARQEAALIRLFELVMYDASERGRRANSAIVVLDFSNFAAKNVHIQSMHQGIQIFLAYYPEIFKSVAIIHYPRFLFSVWKIIAPLLDARSRSRITWIPSPTALQAHLRQWLPADQIPHWMGGEGDTGPLQLFTGEVIDASVVAKRLAGTQKPA